MTTERVHSFSDLNFKNLNEMHRLFLERSQDQNESLDRDSFRSVVKETVGPHLTDEEVDALFAQINAGCSETVCWGDFISCISGALGERSSLEEASMEDPLFKKEIKFKHSQHKEQIVSMRFAPRLSMISTEIDENSGRYVMLGKDGLLSVWSLDLALISYRWIGAEPHEPPLHFIDMVVLYPSTLIAVISTRQSISIWDLSTKGLVHKVDIVALKNCATCLEFWNDLRSHMRSLLVWGDTGGDVNCLQFNLSDDDCIFKRQDHHNLLRRVQFNDILRGKVAGIKMYKATAVNPGWVRRVQYLPEFGSFIACSDCTRKPVCVADWDGKTDRRYFACNKSVLCFCYSSPLKLLVMGCADSTVNVWNFFAKDRRIDTFTGHSRPVVAVAISEVSQHIISVDKGHVVNVHHMWTRQRVQHFSAASLREGLGSQHATGYFFNTARREFLLATAVIARLAPVHSLYDLVDVSSHRAPVLGVAYSSEFQMVRPVENIPGQVADSSLPEVETRQRLPYNRYRRWLLQRQSPYWLSFLSAAVSGLRPRQTIRAKLRASRAKEGTVISACEEGVVTVWNVHKGSPLMQFHHFSSRRPEKDVSLQPEDEKVELTAFALDKTERRVATGGSDGTINVWNFSTGVLINYWNLPAPVTVSSLAIDDVFVFASGLDRVYRMSTGKDPSDGSLKPLRRVHREDISCMVLVHPELLAAASCDGDIVIVSRRTGYTIARLNLSLGLFFMKCNNQGVRTDKASHTAVDSSDGDANSQNEVGDPSTPCCVYDLLEGQYVSREESDRNFKAYENSVNAMVVLTTRHLDDRKTAVLLTAGAEGWIRAWSYTIQGELLGQFCATEGVGETVAAMTTDPDDEFLITGDSLGYVKVWDLLLYCNQAAEVLSESQRDARNEALLKKFYFYRSPFLKDKAAAGCYKQHKRPPPLATRPKTTVKIPQLLSVFRAHAAPITSTAYVAKHQLIITGSEDRTVRLWLLSGRYIGTCGDPWPGLIRPERNMISLRRLPHDIRRCASPRSFKVIHEGRRDVLWGTALALVREDLRNRKNLSLAATGEHADVTAPDDERKDAEASEEGEGRSDRQSQKKEEEEDIGTTSETTLTCSWRDPKESVILGASFKPNLHFRHRPVYHMVDLNKELGQFPAYHKLPFYEMEENTRILTPPIVAEAEKRKLEADRRRSSVRYPRKIATCFTPYPIIPHQVAVSRNENASGCSVALVAPSFHSRDGYRTSRKPASSIVPRPASPGRQAAVAPPVPSHLPPLTVSRGLMKYDRDVHQKVSFSGADLTQ